MQRLARITLTQENQKAIELFGRFKEIRQFLTAHLPPSTLLLFAEPVVKGNIVEWYTTLEGQPQKLSSLQKEHEIRAKIENKLISIRYLLADLQNKQTVSLDKIQAIQELLEAAEYSQKEVYNINNEPVLVGWGIGEPPQPVVPQQSTVVSGSVANKHRWCYWLLPLLFLLIAGLLGWWFLRQPNSIPQIAPEQPKAEIKEEPKVELPKVELKPEVPLPIRIEQEPKPEDRPPALPKIERPKVEDKKEVEKVEEKQPKEDPKKNCTVKVKPEELPQMVIVFDNSPSMLGSLKETPEALNEFFSRWGVGLTSIEENNYMFRAPNRLEVAKKAAASIINNVATNVPIGLVRLSSCPSANNHGFYSQNKRGALIANIKNTYPIVGSGGVARQGESGTPLYNGLQQATAMVDGKKKDAFILLISDGENSCDKTQDVCALATQIAAQKPRLRINVVDIGGAKAANCVARVTKGKVFTANSQKEISSMINQAVKPMQSEEICK